MSIETCDVSNLKFSRNFDDFEVGNLKVFCGKFIEIRFEISKDWKENFDAKFFDKIALDYFEELGKANFENFEIVSNFENEKIKIFAKLSCQGENLEKCWKFFDELMQKFKFFNLEISLLDAAIETKINSGENRSLLKAKTLQIFCRI